MSQPNALNPQEPYTNTIAFTVLRRYDEIVEDLTKAQTVLLTVQAAQKLDRADVGALTAYLNSAAARMHVFSLAYLNSADKAKVLDLATVMEDDERTPSGWSDYGNFRVFLQAVAHWQHVLEGLYRQLSSLQAVMIANKWFDLKKNVTVERPKPWPK